jgi:hypothetical protein
VVLQCVYNSIVLLLDICCVVLQCVYNDIVLLTGYMSCGAAVSV